MNFLRKKEFKNLVLDSKVYEDYSYKPKINKNIKANSKIFEPVKKFNKIKPKSLKISKIQRERKIEDFLERMNKNLEQKKSNLQRLQQDKLKKTEDELDSFKKKRTKKKIILSESKLIRKKKFKHQKDQICEVESCILRFKKRPQDDPNDFTLQLDEKNILNFKMKNLD